MASFVACMFTMYSASVVDNAIVGCRLLLQEMAPPPIMKTNPMVDLLSSRSTPQSASQYPSISLDGVAPNSNFICNVPCKYRKIHLTAMQCSMLGFTMCRLTHLLGMPSRVMCTTWHTSRTQPLVDTEIPLIHHFHSHSFVTSLWDRMELQWAYIPPLKNASIFP